MTETKTPRQTSRFGTLPHNVEAGLHRFGQNLRAARLRRNLSLEDVAERIGISRIAVTDAENGKPSTGVAVYAALLWTYRLLDQLTEIASVENDKEGAALAFTRKRAGTTRRKALDNDF